MRSAPLALVVALALLAAAPAPATAAHSVGELVWLAGAWISDRDGRRGEEHWSPPAGDSMMGMFRLQEGGVTRFVELQTITVEGGQLVLRIRHFTPQLVPWKKEAEQGPLRYVLERLGDQEAIFANPSDDVKQIVYRREKDGGLLIRLVRYEGKTSKHQDFRFRAAGK